MAYRSRQLKIIEAPTAREVETLVKEAVQQLEKERYDVMVVKADPNPQGGWFAQIIYC